jgi:hypothetical protein
MVEKSAKSVKKRRPAGKNQASARGSRFSDIGNNPKITGGWDSAIGSPIATFVIWDGSKEAAIGYHACSL